MVKSDKKLTLGVLTFLIVGSLIFLDSNSWKNFLVKKANETLLTYGWTMDLGVH